MKRPYDITVSQSRAPARPAVISLNSSSRLWAVWLRGALIEYVKGAHRNEIAEPVGIEGPPGIINLNRSNGQD